MDDALRDLERRAAAGEAEARAALERRWEQLGLGWWGERLPVGVGRSTVHGFYRFSADDPFDLYCERLVDGRVVATLLAIAEYTPQPPPAPFEERKADALLVAGYRWALLDMNACPTTSSRSISGLIRCAQRFRDAGGRLVTYGGPSDFRWVVENLGLSAIFDWVPERDDALEVLRGLGPAT